MKHQRTFSLIRLYHKFLKPKNISLEKLPLLTTQLYESGFIILFQHPDEPDAERYTETEKLLSREHRDELFSIIERLR